MIEYENECVGCSPDMGCLGSSCPYMNVARFYCDKCKNEVEELYKYEDKELCADCVLKELEKVEVKE